MDEKEKVVVEESSPVDSGVSDILVEELPAFEIALWQGCTDEI